MLDLIVRPEAEEDVASVYRWYEEQRAGLGLEFLLCFESVLASIQRHPLAHRRIRGPVRRALLRRFPYLVFFLILKTTIYVLAVVHSHRDPKIWRKRTRGRRNPSA